MLISNLLVSLDFYISNEIVDSLLRIFHFTVIKIKGRFTKSQINVTCLMTIMTKFIKNLYFFQN